MLANCRWGSLMSVSMGWKTTRYGHDSLVTVGHVVNHTLLAAIAFATTATYAPTTATYAATCHCYYNVCCYLSFLLQLMMLLVIATTTYAAACHCYYNFCCYLSLLLLLRLLLVIDTLLRLLLVIAITATYDTTNATHSARLCQYFRCCSCSCCCYYYYYYTAWALLMVPCSLNALLFANMTIAYINWHQLMHVRWHQFM